MQSFITKSLLFHYVTNIKIIEIMLASHHCDKTPVIIDFWGGRTYFDLWLWKSVSGHLAPLLLGLWWDRIQQQMVRAGEAAHFQAREQKCQHTIYCGRACLHMFFSLELGPSIPQRHYPLGNKPSTLKLLGDISPLNHKRCFLFPNLEHWFNEITFEII